MSLALKAKPQSADSLAMRGIVLSNLGRYAEALELRTRCWRCVPKARKRITIAAFRFAKLGQHEEAVASYRAGRSRCKFKNPQVFHNLGNSLIELGRPQEALDAYEGRFSGAQMETDTLINRGNALLGLGRSEEALDSYDRALAYDARQRSPRSDRPWPCATRS